jgi:hypothetical protein
MVLTKLQKRYLSRRICGFCDMRLDQDGCGALWGGCSPDEQERRRQNCLSHYKPRITSAQVQPHHPDPKSEQN